MTTSAPTRPHGSAGSAEPVGRAPWIGLGLGAVLIAVAVVLPQVIGWEVHSRAHPETTPGSIDPLHAIWDPRWFGPGTVPAVVLAALGWRWAADLARRLAWRRLLLTSYVAGLAWMVSLALVRGPIGLTGPLSSSYEYLPTAHSTPDISAFLHRFTAHIPIDSPDNLPTHVAGHPPLATLFFIWLDRIGLAGDLVAPLIVTAIGASTALAVMVTLRVLGAEHAARAVAPFLVLTPAAVFICVSADGMFAAVGAWGIAALALSATASPGAVTGRMLGWGVVAGLLLGAAVMLSYGLPVLGLLAVAVLVAARSWRPLPVAALAALAVVVAFVPFGYSWWRAYPVLVDRYWAGTASGRPGVYWTWGNLADLLLSGGPLLAAGLAALVVAARHRGWTDPVRRVVLLLAGAGVLMVAAADASQMSRAEVERIWLPFIPWITVSLVLLPASWRRWGLALQLVTGLLVETLLYTSW